MDVNDEIVAVYGDGDYADNLHPGYRFCPTDSELILHYLKPKIQSQEVPPSRLHEIYLYDYNPQELSERYRSNENKWYFLTSRQRIYAKGDRPSRVTRTKSYWKTTQKQKRVYDDVTGEAVGWKRNLAFFDENKRKTIWLMNEYTTNDPNLPFGSGQNGNKLNDWVLCALYKKTNTNQRAIILQFLNFDRLLWNLMDVNDEIVAAHGDGDYADNLLPGYRFCPTDSELILHYLKPKIHSQQVPPSRLHEIYLYDYNPQELADRYQANENKWYFLTSRQRVYAKGDRPSRVTRTKSYWKTTQKQIRVYDDFTGEAVGWKRNLAFFDENKRKTTWLMNEYTTNDPNLPFGSGENGNKLNDWVLCKIYKKETDPTINTNWIEELQNIMNEGEEEPQNQQDADEPSPVRRRLSATQDNINQPSEPVTQVQMQEQNHDHSTNTNNVGIVAPVNFMGIDSNPQPADNHFDTRGRVTVDPMGYYPYPGDQTLSVNYNEWDGVSHTTMIDSLNPVTVQPLANLPGCNNPIIQPQPPQERHPQDLERLFTDWESPESNGCWMQSTMMELLEDFGRPPGYDGWL